MLSKHQTLHLFPDLTRPTWQPGQSHRVYAHFDRTQQTGCLISFAPEVRIHARSPRREMGKTNPDIWSFLLGVLQINPFEVGDGVAHREARPLVGDRHEVPVHRLKKEINKVVVDFSGESIRDTKRGGRGRVMINNFGSLIFPERKATNNGKSADFCSSARVWARRGRCLLTVVAAATLCFTNRRHNRHNSSSSSSSSTRKLKHRRQELCQFGMSREEVHLRKRRKPS